jgi:hypothetical protein
MSIFKSLCANATKAVQAIGKERAKDDIYAWAPLLCAGASLGSAMGTALANPSAPWNSSAGFAGMAVAGAVTGFVLSNAVAAGAAVINHYNEKRDAAAYEKEVASQARRAPAMAG